MCKNVDLSFPGYIAVKSFASQRTFRRNRLPQPSGLKNKSSKGVFVTSFMLVYCFYYSSALKIEATYSSETSFEFQRISRRNFQNIEFFMTTAVRTSNAICV
jgi:hypothetical protein